MLIDIGSTINLISKTFVYQNKERFKIFKEYFKFQTATGEHRGNKFVTLEGEDIKFFLHDFHDQFNLL